jgi:8-oxo-dGTP pyrophosphatase MutT (NUDIX family)
MTVFQRNTEARDLLLEDYRYRAAMMAESEKSGETRVNLFVVLMTLVSAALIDLVTGDKPLKEQSEFLLVISGLGALLIFGWLTLLRLIKRNKSTDECKHSLDLIRQIYKDNFDETGVLLGYYPVNWLSPKKNKSPTASGTSSSLKKFRSPGGLVHLVAAINGILIGELFAVLCWYAGFTHTLLLLVIALASFFAATARQLAYVQKKEDELQNELKERLPTHAGGVVVKWVDGQEQYLLVKDSKTDQHWVLPKGKIENGEGHGEAALREMKEEAGINARLLGVLGQWNYRVTKSDKENTTEVRLKVYLMAWEGDVETKEQRCPKFYSLNEAINTAQHVETKEILKKAAQAMSKIRTRQEIETE